MPSTATELAPQHPVYGPDYQEFVPLRDGHLAYVSPLRPLHARQFQRGFEKLSPRSRYLRFMSGMRVLSDAQKRYLLHPDGTRHVALAASVITQGGLADRDGYAGPLHFREAGVGRFVQLPDDPGAVEAAITVVDEYQRLGLGTALAVRLLEAARERGYRRVEAELLGENRGMLALMRRMGAPVALERHGSAMRAVLVLAAPPSFST